MTNTKTCSACHITKNISEFFSRSNVKDGRQSRCKSCTRTLSQIHRTKHPEIHRQQHQNRRQKDIEGERKKIREHHRKKYQQDIDYKIKQILRTRIYQILKQHKSASTIELLGCTLDHFKEHISSLFTGGMSWENQGRWHIDHIKPCASFDCTTKENQKACFHYTNMQPLWREENLSKGSRLS